MTDTDRIVRGSRPKRDPSELPGYLESLPVGIPSHSRKEMLRILRSTDDTPLRKAVGYRLYMDIDDPEVREVFIDTLLFDPIPEMRSFAAALLAHPAISGDDHAERCLRHTAESDPSDKVQDRATTTIRFLNDQKKKPDSCS